MYHKILLSILGSGALVMAVSGFLQADTTDMYAVTNCDGTQVVRVEAGKFEMRYVEKNLPGCTGTKVSTLGSDAISPSTHGVPEDRATETGVIHTPEVITLSESVNCSGLKVTKLSNGTYYRTQVDVNLPGCIEAKYNAKIRPTEKRINTENGPLLDTTSTQIVNYRAKQLYDQKIRFTEVMRSVRMRQAATKKSKTVAYLMDNDAVVITGKETGWVKSTGANILVTDVQENTVKADTKGKATGYIASKYLRAPNATDLVRIEQADHAYWSDIAQVQVAHLVNLRAHPWYGASIVAVLTNSTPLYVIATVDNWSEVRNDAGTLHGYVRSDYIKIQKSQRVDK